MVFVVFVEKDLKNLIYSSLKKEINSKRIIMKNMKRNPNEIFDEISEILPKRLYLTSRTSAMKEETYEKYPITHVLSMCPGLTKYPSKESVSFHTIPLVESYTFALAGYIDEAYEYIETILDQNGCLLIHCDYGVSRGPTVIIAYLIRKYPMNFKSAFTLVNISR